MSVGKLGVGVLGVGEMGSRHAENLRRLVPEVQLVAVADVDATRAMLLQTFEHILILVVD